MKKILLSLLASTLAGGAAMAQHEVTCSFTSISSNITSNTTLSASTLYRLEGCIHVTSGVTLTIPAGTVILGQKSSTATLIIDKGGQLVSNGTSSNPVVFSSDQQPTYRAPGDWGGIIVLGKATNNQSNAITLSNRCSSITGGGTNDNDNSGTYKYMRIEYPQYGLTLNSVGDATTVNNVQVSYASQDAFELLGGTVNAKYLVSLNAGGIDQLSKFGNRSLVQYVINVRLDATAHISTGDKSNSILFSNNDNSAGSYAGTPMNHPVFSNVSIIGPAYCGATGLSSDFKNGVLIYHNSEGTFANGVVAGWPTGLRMEDATTIANATSNGTLFFYESSFYSNTTADYSNAGTWSATCATTMANWMTGSGFCSQANNQLPVTTLGYNSSICGNYATTTPTFKVGTTTLSNSDYPSGSDLDNAFFTSSTQLHGALNTSTDYTANWAEWNPQAHDYCPHMMSSPTSVASISAAQNSNLQIAPNPTNGITYAIFTAQQAGQVKIDIVNGVGQVVRTITHDVTTGQQKIAINTDGLSSGIYVVNVSASIGSVTHARLVIK